MQGVQVIILPVPGPVEGRWVLRPSEVGWRDVGRVGYGSPLWGPQFGVLPGSPGESRRPQGPGVGTGPVPPPPHVDPLTVSALASVPSAIRRDLEARLEEGVVPKSVGGVGRRAGSGSRRGPVAPTRPLSATQDHGLRLGRVPLREVRPCPRGAPPARQGPSTVAARAPRRHEVDRPHVPRRRRRRPRLLGRGPGSGHPGRAVGRRLRTGPVEGSMGESDGVEAPGDRRLLSVLKPFPYLLDPT